jgi:hypothetical protein
MLVVTAVSSGDTSLAGQAGLALLSDPTSTRLHYICSLSFGRLQTFLKVKSCGEKSARAHCGWCECDVVQLYSSFFQGQVRLAPTVVASEHITELD